MALAASSAVLVPSGKKVMRPEIPGTRSASRRLAAGSSGAPDDIHHLLHAVEVGQVEPLEVDPLHAHLLQGCERLGDAVRGADDVPGVGPALLQLLAADAPPRRGGVT